MISKIIIARARLSSFGDRLRAFEQACRPCPCPCVKGAAEAARRVHGGGGAPQLRDGETFADWVGAIDHDEHRE